MRIRGSRHEESSADVVTHLDINNEAIPTRPLGIILAKLIQTNELGKEQSVELKAGLNMVNKGSLPGVSSTWLVEIEITSKTC